MITKSNDKFYIVTEEGFQECSAKAIHTSNIFDLFVHETESGWKVTEAMSGKEIAGSTTRPAVIKEAARILGNFTQERLSELISMNIQKTGLSPRYKLGPGLTNEYVTANMCLTAETAGPKQEKKVATKTPSRTEQAKEQRAGEIGTDIAVVKDPLPSTGQLDIFPDANVMSAEDAVRIEANIERSSSNVSKWLMQLYRGRAYVSRGFPTWEAYYADVTGKSRASAYRAVDEAIQKEKLIEMGVPAKFNAKQIAALKPIIEKGPEAIEAVLKDAKKIVTAKDANEKVKSEFHNTGTLPASAIKKAVEKVIPPAPAIPEVNGHSTKPVDVTGKVESVPAGKEVTVQSVEYGVTAVAEDDEQAQIDVETPRSHVESANPDTGGNVHLLHFAACAWHLGPDTGIPTGCLKVETREGGYVLVPYSAIYEMYNEWPAEFLMEDGSVKAPGE